MSYSQKNDYLCYMIYEYLILSVITIILCSILSAVIIPRIVKYAHSNKLLDQPNNRKVHSEPIPRLGGLCFLPVTAVVLMFEILLVNRFFPNYGIEAGMMTTQHLSAYFVGAIALYAVGLIDDVIGLSFKSKFAAQIFSAIALCVGGLWIANGQNVFGIGEMPYWIGMPLTVFYVVYVTNAVNLIDGIDGLASGLSCISLFVIILMGFLTENYVCVLFSSAFLGTVVAFFYFNVFNHKNKVFMGDTGSLSLGFALSFLTIPFMQKDVHVVCEVKNLGIIVVSTLIVPLFDVVRVFISRVRDGRNPFMPDKNHIHHKLLRVGFHGKITMLILLLIQVFFISANIYLSQHINETLLIVTDIVLFCVMHIVINHFIYIKERISGKEWSRNF